MIKEMNPEVFKQSLHAVIKEITNTSLSEDKCVFLLNPIIEEGKNRNAKDEFMRLNVLSPQYIKGKKFSFEETVAILTFFSPLVPIWINVKLIDKSNEYIFLLDLSVRFRKPSLLRNQETGHAPFKAII